jgi:hypothetical protein
VVNTTELKVFVKNPQEYASMAHIGMIDNEKYQRSEQEPT